MKTKHHNHEWELSLCSWQNFINAGNSAQFWLGLMKTDTKQRDVLHGKLLSTGKVLDLTTAILGRADIRLMPQTHKEIVFHFCTQFHHIQWSNGWSRSYFFFLPQMLEQTCKLVDSHLRSKEANIRLSQLSWAWFRKKCKQLYNSNIIMSPSIYKGGSRRTDSVHIENSRQENTVIKIPL